MNAPAKAVLAALSAGLAAWLANPPLITEQTGSRFRSAAIHPVADVFTPLPPSTVEFSGFLERRYNANISNWLLTKNEDSLLSCYTRRPGAYAWQGEHVGKWIHAATLAWANTRNAELRRKLDRVVATLLSTQLDDGYLGTYPIGFHWSRRNEYKWDVWVHKYNLIGLLTYAEFTGSAEALKAAKKIGDLLISTFGPRGRMSLNKQGPHSGMVSGSILEPVLLLYRATSQERYLQFALFITNQWEQSGGNKLISSLTNGTSVRNTGNGKAYEMLSCLVGLSELYRATGDSTYLLPVLNAWNNIKHHQLLPTGSGSRGEFWLKENDTCGDACDGLGEVCVTVTWMQLNQQLLRLTGDVRYADELERTIYNHLASAQKSDGSAWSYFTNLQGKKNYSPKQTCCSSSGPRGWASLPMYAYMLAQDGVVVNVFSTGKATMTLRSGESVTVTQTTEYPANGDIRLVAKASNPANFAVYIRIPSWSQLEDRPPVSGQYSRFISDENGVLDTRLRLKIPTYFERNLLNPASATLIRGPQVLALDGRFNPPSTLANPPNLQVFPQFAEPIQGSFDIDGQPVYKLLANRYTAKAKPDRPDAIVLMLSPFSSAGAEGTFYRVWLPVARESSATHPQQ
ncbi:MAG: glycoside hydrolase family 127 protein [Bacteroidetes bacterium]|nr:glycoside hydrolase family 127 protein [Bacteroidota bacterium]MCW5897468.1 glycoside hydrolase family 127 protein [Bacteroidota bacterium]